MTGEIGSRAERVAARIAECDPRTPLVDARAAAVQLGVPSSWLLAEARANRIPHVRLGKYVRFAPDALARWADEQMRGPRRHAA